MADVSKLPVLDNITTLDQLKEYVYKLQKQVTFLLENIDEDNLSSGLLAQIKSGGENGELMSAIEQTEKMISMKVSKGDVISEINQSAEMVQINAQKINLNGAVTANENFKILEDGSMKANAGTFSGNVAAVDGSIGALVAGQDGVTINGTLNVTGNIAGMEVTPEAAGLEANTEAFVVPYSDSTFGSVPFYQLMVTDGNQDYSLVYLSSSPSEGGGGGGGSVPTQTQVIQLSTAWEHSTVTVRDANGTNIGSLARGGYAVFDHRETDGRWKIKGKCDFSNWTISNFTALVGYIDVTASYINGPYVTESTY